MIQRIKVGQLKDTKLQKIRERVEQGVSTEYSIHSDEIIKFGTRMCISDNTEIRKEIFKEAHNIRFIIHLGSTKMYRDL